MVLHRAIEKCRFTVRLRLRGRSADLLQNVERTVHGGEPDGLIAACAARSDHDIVKILSGGIPAKSRKRFDDCTARPRGAISVSGETREQRGELCRAIGFRSPPAAGALHRGRSACARASIIAVNNDRRFGENAVDRKKHAVAASTIVDPDAAFR